MREVAEETGITGRVIGKLGTIDFWFVAEGRRVHKTVHHYLLLVTDPVHGLELSDADVEVSEVAWVPLDEAVAAVLDGRLQNGILAASVLAAHVAQERGWSTLRPHDAPWPQGPGGAQRP